MERARISSTQSGLPIQRLTAPEFKALQEEKQRVEKASLEQVQKTADKNQEIYTTATKGRYLDILA